MSLTERQRQILKIVRENEPIIGDEIAKKLLKDAFRKPHFFGSFFLRGNAEICSAEC